MKGAGPIVTNEVSRVSIPMVHVVQEERYLSESQPRTTRERPKGTAIVMKESPRDVGDKENCSRNCSSNASMK